jgi:Tfp pilus assembly protein PilN
MIQFNLLPDVKQQYIKALRTKRLVMVISFVASAVALTVLLILVLSVYVVQKKNINDLKSSIATNSSELKSTPQLATVLTVQSQLNSLATLNSQNPEASRLFDYLTQLTPTQVTIADFQIDFTMDTVVMTGNAPSLAAVNTFVDNLKYTTYTVSGEATSQSAFSSVVLTSFGFDSTGTASYSISYNFDPTIFNNGDTVTLSVGGNPPASAAQQPSIIFSKGT